MSSESEKKFAKFFLVKYPLYRGKEFHEKTQVRPSRLAEGVEFFNAGRHAAADSLGSTVPAASVDQF